MIANREQFKQYILSRLGEPVSKVNVTEQQLQYCIDDALQMWSQFHSEGSIRTFLKQIVTPSILKVTSTRGLKSITAGSLITGLTSGATAHVCKSYPHDDRNKSCGGLIYCQDIIEHDFLPGEVIEVCGKRFTLATDPQYQTKGIIDERKFKVPDYVLGITRLLPANTATSSQNLFDVQYQLRMSDLYDLSSTSLIYYEQAMEHLDLLNFELSANPSFEFNQYDGYCYPICKWGIDFGVGDYMIMECYRALDPKTAWKMWNEPWLKNYATALVKLQFAQNLSKYQGVPLPGGITFNASEMKSEAKQEITELEQQLMNLMPVSAFLIG